MDEIDKLSVAAEGVRVRDGALPLQVKNLAIFVACLNLIIASGLGPRGSIVALMLVLLVFATPVLALIGLYSAVPQSFDHARGLANMDGEQ